MKILLQLVSRNLKLYLRDRAAVFFSFLSVIIIILMYLLFLGKLHIRMAENNAPNVEHIGWMVSAWIMAGLLTVSTVTVPLGVIGNLIDDRDKGILNDFYTSPINRNILALSYLISAWVIGFIMVVLNLAVGQIYVLTMGGELLSFISVIKIMLMILFSIMTFTSFFFYIANFTRTRSAYGTLSTLVGTFVGFLGGIYIQIGNLSKNLQNVMNILPTSHSVSLMRRIYLEAPIEAVFGPNSSQDKTDYLNFNGVNIFIGNHELSNIEMILGMFVFMLIFYTLSVLKLSKSKL